MTLRYKTSRWIKARAFRPRVRKDGLALLGGTPVRDPRIPWPPWPVIELSDRIALVAAFESGKWWYGEKVRAFEEKFAAFQTAKHCVTCSTGTIGLEIMMQAHGIQPGDEVIVPAFSFVATATAVARMGGKPVFVDVDESWCLDPEKTEAAVTDRTVGILPVHFAGRVADMDRLQSVADKHGLEIYEDACHSWGSSWQSKGTGALGRAGAFSFQMFKNLTAAEGGAITTDDDRFADLCRSIVNCGRVKDRPWYHHAVMGTNARITELQAVILLSQLARLDEQTERREANAARLDRGLADIEGIVLQPGDPRISRRAYHLYAFRLIEEEFGCTRSQFVSACQAEGLPITEMYYPEPLYRQPVFAEHPSGAWRDVHCPVAEDLAWKTALWLNHWLLLGDEQDVDDIIEIIRKVKTHARQIR